ncbi:MAG: hypothetical protein AAB267_05370, partial [Candidatus Desantisbacteria bacterium]
MGLMEGMSYDKRFEILVSFIEEKVKNPVKKAETMAGMIERALYLYNIIANGAGNAVSNRRFAKWVVFSPDKVRQLGFLFDMNSKRLDAAIMEFMSLIPKAAEGVSTEAVYKQRFDILVAFIGKEDTAYRKIMAKIEKGLAGHGFDFVAQFMRKGNKASQDMIGKIAARFENAVRIYNFLKDTTGKKGFARWVAQNPDRLEKLSFLLDIQGKPYFSNVQRAVKRFTNLWEDEGNEEAYNQIFNILVSIPEKGMKSKQIASKLNDMVTNALRLTGLLVSKLNMDKKFAMWIALDSERSKTFTFIKGINPYYRDLGTAIGKLMGLMTEMPYERQYEILAGLLNKKDVGPKEMTERVENIVRVSKLLIASGMSNNEALGITLDEARLEKLESLNIGWNQYAVRLAQAIGRLMKLAPQEPTQRFDSLIAYIGEEKIGPKKLTAKIRTTLRIYNALVKGIGLDKELAAYIALDSKRAGIFSFLAELKSQPYSNELKAAMK